MTSTLTRNTDTPNGVSNRDVGIAPTGRRHRSIPLAVVAVTLMITSIAAFVGLQRSGSERSAVLAVARPVGAGSVLTNEDLTVAEVGADPALRPVPLSARESVVGRRVAVDLQPGALLVESALGDARALADGEALVGLEALPSAAPTSALATGDQVQLIEIPANTGSEPGPGSRTVLTEGRVIRAVDDLGTTGAATQLVVAVPVQSAPSVAAAAAQQRVAVVVVP